MFLSDKTDEKMREKVIKMEPGLAKAQKIMDYINSSPEEIELYENRELTRMDIKSAKRRDIQEGIEIGEEKGIIKGKKEGIEIGEEKGIIKGKKEGIEIGEEKGIKKEKIETAKRLKEMELSVEDIAKATKLSLKFIEKL